MVSDWLSITALQKRVTAQMLEELEGYEGKVLSRQRSWSGFSREVYRDQLRLRAMREKEPPTIPERSPLRLEALKRFKLDCEENERMLKAITQERLDELKRRQGVAELAAQDVQDYVRYLAPEQYRTSLRLGLATLDE